MQEGRQLDNVDMGNKVDKGCKRFKGDYETLKTYRKQGRSLI